MSLSPKALGLTCAFFGIVLSVGAVAALSSGKLNWLDAVQAIRGGMSLCGGVMLMAISAQLFKKTGGR